MVRLVGLRKITKNKGKAFIPMNSLFRRSKITVNGAGSFVKIGNTCRFRNLIIEVCGNDSCVEIHDVVSGSVTMYGSDME